MSGEIAFDERWVWLAGSLCIATIAIAVRWILERPRSLTTAATETRPPANTLPVWTYQIARMVYAVGIPALALFWRGALTSTGLGLQPFFWTENASLNPSRAGWDNWAHDIGWTCASAAGVWLLVTIGDYSSTRFSGHRPAKRHSLGLALREAIYHQTHWAFYREPFVLLWGSELGAWAGLIPVAGEAIVNPYRWTDLQSPDRGRDLVIRTGLAVMSAVLYVQTQNIWPVLVADTILVWLLGHAPEST